MIVTAPPPPLTAARACVLTRPNGSRPPGVSRSTFYGNGRLWVESLGVIAPEPGDVRADGSIGAKVAWYAARVHGSLRIDGFRVDRESAKRVRGRHIVAASSEDGFRGSAFWTSEVVFPSAGCWRVTGTVGAARLSFVVRVR